MRQSWMRSCWQTIGLLYQNRHSRARYNTDGEKPQARGRAVLRRATCDRAYKEKFKGAWMETL
eukprot:5209487-Pleurochrysis_carterae.AAC.2